MITSFFITSEDSATFVIGMFGGNGTLNPSNRIKMIWGIFISASAIVLLISGDAAAVQTVSTAFAFPFYIMMVIMCGRLLKAVRQEKEVTTQEKRANIIESHKHSKGEITKNRVNQI
nr:BCCT family transporter [Priestia megaterium]